MMLLQVGYISEYPHTGVDSAAAVEQGVGLHELFWGGRNMELEDGKKVFGQVWPKVGVEETVKVCFMEGARTRVVNGCCNVKGPSHLCWACFMTDYSGVDAHCWGWRTQSVY